jgi:hypothetical protein
VQVVQEQAEGEARGREVAEKLEEGLQEAMLSLHRRGGGRGRKGHAKKLLQLCRGGEENETKRKASVRRASLFFCSFPKQALSSLFFSFVLFCDLE